MVRGRLILYKVANNLPEWPMPETHTDRDLSVTATRPGLVLRRREAAGPSAPFLREWSQRDKQAKKGSS